MLSRFLSSAAKRYQLVGTAKNVPPPASFVLSRDDMILGFCTNASTVKRMFSLSTKALNGDTLPPSLGEEKENNIEKAVEDLIGFVGKRYTPKTILDTISSLENHFLLTKRPRPFTYPEALGIKKPPPQPNPERDEFPLEVSSKKKVELGVVLSQVMSSIAKEQVHETMGKSHSSYVEKNFGNKTDEELEALLAQETSEDNVMRKMIVEIVLHMRRAQKTLPIFERIRDDLESAIISIARTLRLPDASSQEPPDHHILVKEIEEWTTKNNCLKIDYSLPRKLADRPMKLVDHLQTKERAVELLYRRQHLMRISGNQDSKNSNFLICIQSSPGGGKSLTLELIAGLGRDPDLDQIIERLALRNPDSFSVSKWMFKGAAGVTITHIGALGFIEGETSEQTDEFLGWRIMASYFTNGSLHSFVSKFRPRMKMSSDFAIKTVLKCETEKRMKELGVTNESDIDEEKKPHIILCVDELLKIPNSLTLLHCLGLILDNHQHVSVVVSTLDAYYLTYESSTDSHSPPDFGPSGRSLKWIPLRRLSMPSVLDIFRKQFSSRSVTQPDGKVETVVDFNSNPELLHVLCMAGGHPRTLGTIHSLLSSKNFVEDLLHALENDSIPLQENIVCAAIRGDPLAPDYQFDLDLGKIGSFSDLIRDGVFINTLKSHPNERAIPLLSMLRIQAFFLRRPSSSEPTEYALGTYKCLAEIAALKPVHGAIDLYFEKFHPQWEIARRTSFLDKRIPAEVDPGYKVPSFDLASDIYGTHGSDSPGRTPCPILWGSSVRFFATRSSTGAVKDHVLLKRLEDLGKIGPPFTTVYSVEGNNPGFDLLILEQSTTRKKPIAILVELKSKSSEAGTYLTRVAIRNKIHLCVEQFNGYLLDGRGARSCVKGLKDLSQVYIVFASLQSVSEETLNDVKTTFQKIYGGERRLSVLHPGEGKGDGKDGYSEFKGYFPHNGSSYYPISLPNVIFLTREQLLNLYSPTLSYTPHFLSSQEILTVNPEEPITKKPRGHPSNAATPADST